MASFKDYLGQEADKAEKQAAERAAKLVSFRHRINQFDTEYRLTPDSDPSRSGTWRGDATRGLEVIKKHLPRSLKSTEKNMQEIADFLDTTILWKRAEVGLRTTTSSHWFGSEPVSTSGELVFWGTFTYKGRNLDVEYIYSPGA